MLYLYTEIKSALRRFLLYTLVVFTMLNIVSLNQFSHLPVILVHYIQHTDKDHNLSFSGFLSMHYLGNDMNDNDEQQDKQLPFKSLSASTILVFTQPSNVFITFNAYESRAVKSISQFKNVFFSHNALSSLLRPPIDA